MNIAIVDDEKIIREQISKLLIKYEPNCHIKTYETGRELLAEDSNFDILFLDIQMDGINGIDTARELRKKQEDTILIFITGIRDYVFEAFDVAAFHYLLKPLEEEKFAKVFERAKAEAEKRKDRRNENIFIKTKKRSFTINKNNILYVESRRKKVEIHTDREMIEIYAAMSEMERQLGNGFYRCHRGYLVNMAHITEYETDRIRLSTGEEVYMAKERYDEFVKAYMRYLRNGGTVCV